jgi:hypothetical protein
MLQIQKGMKSSFSRDQLVLNNEGLMQVHTEFDVKEVDEDILVVRGGRFILARHRSVKVKERTVMKKLLDWDDLSPTPRRLF